jgi:hypothetical protein
MYSDLHSFGYTPRSSKSTNVIQHTNTIRENNYTIISIDEEKVLNKI